ncbi:MAG: FKBP-type peptidyl-prolyl cis-trans isomerase [Gemmatimonadaceae bacterium]
MTKRRLIAVAALVAACSPNDSSGPPATTVIPLEQQQWASSLNINLAAMTKVASGVYFLDTVVGTGGVVTGSPRIRFYYTGYLANGSRFDTNVGASSPANFLLSELIPGWQSGLQGMKVGGKRRLLIPSALGYGPAGSGNTIPPNANLVFDLELVGLG